MERVNKFLTVGIGLVITLLIGVTGLVYTGLQSHDIVNLIGVAPWQMDALMLPGLAAVYAAGGALALLRPERFKPWQQVGQTVLILGGYVLLLGAVEAVDDIFRYPGLPDVLPPLFGLGYTGLIATLRSEFPPLDPIHMLSGVGVGALCAAGWALGGMLGLEVELLIALPQAASIGGVVWLALSTLPDEGPLAFTLLGGFLLTAALPTLLAVYGAGLQTFIIGASLVFVGFTAASLSSWASPAAGAGLVAGAVAVPLALTEAVEIAFGLLPPEVGTALLVTLGLSALAAIALFVLAAVEAPARPLPAALAGLPIVLIVYVLGGGRWFQPHTYLVVMADQPDTTEARTMDDLAARRAAVYEELTTFAAGDQAAVLDVIGSRAHTPFYVVNAIEVQGGGPLLRLRLMLHPDVDRILTSPRPRPSRTPEGMPPVTNSAYTGPLPWGIEAINADRVWEELGVRGEGIVVGSADSGVAWTHPALAEGYRGGEAAHSSTWFDPWEGTAAPIDTNGHGTHTLGTVVGRGGIGVAPEATWIGCRNLALNLGNPAYYLSCMEFLFAPGGDITQAADIVNNSWGCPPEEGCDPVILGMAVAHLADAGQLNVFGAGNSGPRCGTIYGASLADDAITVGAVDRMLTAVAFSSRGDGDDQPDLDLSAPGAGVQSAVPGGYEPLSGTSMAAPHVTGTATLMWSANPALRGQIEETERILRETAQRAAPVEACGAGGTWNQTLGYGVLDAYRAVQAAIEYGE